MLYSPYVIYIETIDIMDDIENIMEDLYKHNTYCFNDIRVSESPSIKLH